MTNSSSFRDLKVWRDAMILVEEVYKLSARFPGTERFGLTSQIRRAAVSIPSNIGEGKRRKRQRAFLNHLDIALGSQGELTSHPELLDWLATEFVQRKWSLKAMHRLMVTSSTYRQSSQPNQQAVAKDRENRLFWRANPHRLEAEAIRDSILVVSGKLNRTMGGPGIYPRIDPGVIASGSRPRWPLDAREGPDVWRRSVYIFVKRSVLMPLIEVFDCPVTTVSAPVRSVSTVSPQALALLNNEFVLEQARYFAERVERDAGPDRRRQVVSAFRIALNRDPSSVEIAWSLDFLAKQKEPLRDFCHALLNLNEFIYLD